MNDENLIPLNRRDPEERKRIQAAGAAASVKSRQERATLRRELLALLDDDETRGQVCKGLIEKAARGDARAFQVLRDTIGEQPSQKIEFGGRVLSYEEYMSLNEDERQQLDLFSSTLSMDAKRHLFDDILHDCD